MSDSKSSAKTELDLLPRTSVTSARLPQGARIVVLTISDGCAQGLQEDRSGPAVVALLESAGAATVVQDTLPDELEQIAAALRFHAAAGASLIVTTGGTGLATRDVTPEATRQVCERLVDGLAERMRAEGLRQTPLAALSRGVCGTISSATGGGLIVNLPGSPAGAVTSHTAIQAVLPHPLDLLAGQTLHR